MTININESFLTEKALDYAKLSDLAYAKWIRQGNSWILDPDQKDFSRYKEIWKELADLETGKGYTIVDHTPNDWLSGFSATIFYKDGRDILAIRGTEKTDPRDIVVADGDILMGQLPAGQYESMVRYINEKTLYDFDITGHSLGGCLAQAAKATFVGVEDVYIYNSPGAKAMVEGRF